MILNRPAQPGELLRLARQACGWSQLALSLVLDISQRHVSFVESGRACPSRQVILDWTQATCAGDALRDAILLLAGLAPGPRHVAAAGHIALLDEPLRRLLAANTPFPMAAFDLNWNIVGMNASGEWLAPYVMDRYWRKCDGCGVGMDMLDALCDDDGLLHAARNAPQAGLSLLAQLTQEAWLNPGLAVRVQRLEASLSRRYGLRNQPAGTAQPQGPRRLDFDTVFGALAFYMVQFSSASLAGNAAAGLRLEQWMPADEHTARVLQHHTSAPQPVA